MKALHGPRLELGRRAGGRPLLDVHTALRGVGPVVDGHHRRSGRRRGGVDNRVDHMGRGHRPELLSCQEAVHRMPASCSSGRLVGRELQEGAPRGEQTGAGGRGVGAVQQGLVDVVKVELVETG